MGLKAGCARLWEEVIRAGANAQMARLEETKAGSSSRDFGFQMEAGPHGRVTKSLDSFIGSVDAHSNRPQPGAGSRAD